MTTRIDRDFVLARVKQLAPLPRVVHDLDAALRDDGCSAQAIVQLVAGDQALSAAALRLANSSFYGVSGRVVSLRDAVQILGMQTLALAVTTVAVMARFDRHACPGLDLEACWRHALASAVCAREIARARGLDDCAAYTCGLLHDLGTLALATEFPVEYAATLDLRRRLDLTPVEAERRVLGIDHAEVGAAVAGHWRFAPVLCDAIGLHHDVPDEHGPVLLDVIHFADNVAHALDLSREADAMVPHLSIATWDRLALGGEELDRLFECIERQLDSHGASTAGQGVATPGGLGRLRLRKAEM